MDFNHHHENQSSYELNNKVMLIAVFSLAFVVVFVIILHIYAKYVLRHPRVHSSIFTHNHQPPPSKPGLDPAVISSLPYFPFKQADNNGHELPECVICLSTLEDGDVARQLPNCNHVFHVVCIDSWLINQATCPVCRADPTQPPELPSGSELEVGVVVVVLTEGSHQNDVTTKVANNGSNTSSSSSFRLGSFRKTLGKQRSSLSSSTTLQADAQSNFELQDAQ